MRLHTGNVGATYCGADDMHAFSFRSSDRLIWQFPWLRLPVLLAALAAVIGHNWMVWLKFSGGKGMGVTVGALLVLFPIYGYPLQLGIFAAVVIVPLVITRNVALSLGIGLLALPFIVWLATNSGFATILAIVLGLLIVIKSLPTALAALSKSRGTKGFIFDHWQRGDSQKKG